MAPPVPRALRASALVVAVCTALLGVACKDDGGGGGALSIEGTFTNEPSAAAAAHALPITVGPPACELSLSSFAVVQSGRQAVILHGIGGAGGGSIPASINDQDQFEVDHEIVDEDLGTTTHVTGTLDAFFSAARLDGTLTMEIAPLGAPTLFDCGPTVFDVSASRVTKSLPGPDVGIGDADGDWDLAQLEIATTCEPLAEPLRVVDVHVETDFAGASALLTVDDGVDETQLDATLVDRFIVAKWSLEEAGTVERNLTVLQYRAPVVLPQDFMFGVHTSVVDDGESTCVARDELLAPRPPS